MKVEKFAPFCCPARRGDAGRASQGVRQGRGRGGHLFDPAHAHAVREAPEVVVADAAAIDRVAEDDVEVVVAAQDREEDAVALGEDRVEARADGGRAAGRVEGRGRRLDADGRAPGWDTRRFTITSIF